MINKRLDIIEEQIKEIKEFIKDDDYFKMLENGLNITNEKNDKLHKENIKYKEIINDAIEYIEKYANRYFICPEDIETWDTEFKDLLNILNGVDKE